MDRGPRRKGPPGGRKHRGKPPARRMPPQAATGRESRFYDESASAGATLTFLLRDGSRVRGVVSEHDRDSIHVTDDAGTGLVLRKNEIRYLLEDE